MHTAIAVAVRDVQIALGTDREVRRPIERPARPRDRHVVLAVVAGVGRRIERAERAEQLALRRELANGVVAVVGGPDGAVGRDRDPMRAISELALAPRAQEVSLVVVRDDRMVAATDQEHPILTVDRDSGHVAMLEPFRELLPAVDDVICHVRLLARFYYRALPPRARSYTVTALRRRPSCGSRSSHCWWRAGRRRSRRRSLRARSSSAS